MSHPSCHPSPKSSASPSPLPTELYTAHVPTADPASVSDLSATGLRDHLLALNPLDPNWVAQVNKAEAEYWRRSAGVRVGYSDEILGFDCGGQQWVLETAFKVADSLDEIPASGSRDIQYMETLMAEIKRAKVRGVGSVGEGWEVWDGSVRAVRGRLWVCRVKRRKQCEGKRCVCRVGGWGLRFGVTGAASGAVRGAGSEGGGVVCRVRGEGIP